VRGAAWARSGRRPEASTIDRQPSASSRCTIQTPFHRRTAAPAGTGGPGAATAGCVQYRQLLSPVGSRGSRGSQGARGSRGSGSGFWFRVSTVPRVPKVHGRPWDQGLTRTRGTPTTWNLEPEPWAPREPAEPGTRTLGTLGTCGTSGTCPKRRSR